MSSWIYLKIGVGDDDTEWMVGFYDPKGTFRNESSHGNPNNAAARVHYLNGGSSGLDDLDRKSTSHLPEHGP